MYIHIYIYIHFLCINILLCIYIYIHIYICLHTEIHIYKTKFIPIILVFQDVGLPSIAVELHQSPMSWSATDTPTYLGSMIP